MGYLNITEEYLADLMVRMAHHSTAIEGNTLTLGETKSILIDGYIPRAMDMREFHEVNNYKTFMPIFIQAIKSHTEITLPFICEIHKALCNQAIEAVPGEFKVSQNMILGADFIPTPPYLVRTALEDWRQNLFAQLNASKGDNDKILEAICYQHINFEHIHPFPDGNGRVGRLLMVYTCFEQEIIPPIIPVERRNEYINYMNNNDYIGLTAFCKSLQTVEKARILGFSHGISVNLKIGISENISNLQQLT